MVTFLISKTCNSDSTATTSIVIGVHPTGSPEGMNIAIESGLLTYTN